MIVYTCKSCGIHLTMDIDEELDYYDAPLITGTHEGEVYIYCDECGSERKIY